MKAELVPEEELERAKNQIEASFVWRQDSVHSRAASLARFELLGSWRLSETEFVPLVRAVTAGDLQRVARAYFPADRKNAAILLPADARGAGREADDSRCGASLAAVPLLLVGDAAAPPASRRRSPIARCCRTASRLLVAPRPAMPIVVVRVYVRAGSAFDPPDAPGLANLTAELLTRGTAARTGPELDRAIEFVGGGLEAEAGRDGSTADPRRAAGRISIWASTSSPRRCCGRPSPRTSCGARSSEIQAAIQRSEENPEVRRQGARSRGCSIRATRTRIRWRGPASRSASSRASRSCAFTAAHYRPDATVIAVVGDVGVDEIRQALVAPALGVDGARRAWMRPIPLAPPSPPVVAETISRELTQATVYLGRPAIRQDHPDYFPLLVANYILGGGSASRLYTRVREDAGLAYSVGSALSPGRYGAACTVSLQTRVDGVAEALRLVKDEMAAMGRAPVEERELELAKSYLIGSFPLRLDTSAKVAETLTAIEEYGLGLDYPDRFKQAVARVTGPTSSGWPPATWTRRRSRPSSSASDGRYHQ